MSAGKSHCSGLACIYLLPQTNRRCFWEMNIRGCKKMTLAWLNILTKASFFKCWAMVTGILYYSFAAPLPELHAVISGFGEWRTKSPKPPGSITQPCWAAGWVTSPHPSPQVRYAGRAETDTWCLCLLLLWFLRKSATRLQWSQVVDGCCTELQSPSLSSLKVFPALNFV